MADKNECPKCPDEGLPGWMGTFADMMTLLMCFFVLLFAMSSLDPVKIQMMQELESFWSSISSSVRCIILTGQGEKAFSAGADLKERYGLDESTWRKQHEALQRAMMAMSACPVPILAAVNGYAFGGGFELALAADMIYASTSARFALPEVRLGIMPGALGTQHLPRACGLRRAKEWILTGRQISVDEVLETGVVNALFEPSQLIAKTLEIAISIANNAPLSIRHAKASIQHAIQPDVTADYAVEVAHYNQLLASSDRQEGIAAFNEKRPAHFKGE